MRTFVVEEAGCESCAKLVRSALEPLAAVESIDVDEQADLARVTLAADVPADALAAALAEASAGSGHAYRVRAG